MKIDGMIVALSAVSILNGLAVIYLSMRIREIEHHLLDHIEALIEHHDENYSDPR